MREFDLVAVFSACSFFLSSQCLLVPSQKGSLVGTRGFFKFTQWDLSDWNAFRSS